MFPLTLTLHSLAQLNAVLAALHASPSSDVPRFEPRDQAEPDAPKPPAAASSKPAETAPTSPTAEAAPSPAAVALAKKDETSAAELGVDTSAVVETTYDDVKKAILEVSKSKGRDAALKLLAQFGAEKGPDLQKTPEKFGAFVTAANALLKA